MFYPYAQRKGLGFEQEFLIVQKPENIPCRVAGGQDDGRRFEGISIGGFHSFNNSVADDQAGHFLFKQELAAAGEYLFAHGGDDAGQFIGADMGMGFVQDAFVRRSNA